VGNRNLRVEVDGRPFVVRLPGNETELLALYDPAGTRIRA
jgi:hypothetical protein